MKIGAIPNPRATLALGVFFLTVNLANALYALNRLQPSGAFLLVYYVGAALVVAYWIESDTRRLGLPTSVDHGWFAFALWPLALPYHLVKTRGGRGVVTLMGLVGVVAITYVMSLIFFFAVRFVKYGK